MHGLARFDRATENRKAINNVQLKVIVLQGFVEVWGILFVLTGYCMLLGDR